ncbi:RIC1 domain-containing protein [Mycena sanguinolenta]|uniref:RIC1 domain-containing protein n=1 Tax=Mycena sanguinolenta TaxID=230812 RepID=A0A8H6YXX4_9AGAR|nr:RIC1 domain-containing protein [Mycena sanguinolenta]
MYFPTTTAHQLSSIPALPNIPPESEKVIALVPSPRKSLFCTLSRTGVSIWRVRPSAVLAYLSRTPTSILDHGENLAVYWAPDGGRIIIQTSQSYLVLITVVYLAETPIYVPPPLPSTSRNYFLPGPGEALPLQCVSLRFEGVIRVDGGLICVSPRKQYILFSTKNPPAVQRIPWPEIEEEHEPVDGEPKTQFGTYETWIFNDHDFDFFVDPDVTATKILYSRATGVETWITSDGRAYFVGLSENIASAESDDGSGSPKTARQHHQSPSTDSTGSTKRPKSTWQGTCIHDFETPRWVQKSRRVDPQPDGADADTEDEVYPTPSQSSDSLASASASSGKGKARAVYNEPRRAVAVAINGKFSLVAVGMANGAVQYTPFPTGIASAPQSVQLQVPTSARGIGPVCTMEWSGDGYVLAVGWRDGWAIFSVGGRCLAKGFGEDVDTNIDTAKFQDMFMFGVRSLFWAPGNFELVVLAQPSPTKLDGQLFVIPFAKSASTGQLAPDNTRYAFLQMDDRALVYRGADQPDMSVINPESDVWQHIKIPQTYLATNWPIRYSSLSSDGRLIAIAGRRGLIHYSSTSGRWKLFADEIQEQAFVVKGGMVWFHHVLIAAVEVSKSYQIRLYSRDMELSNQNVLHREIISCPVVILSLVDNSLLVYTADNTLFHYLIVPTADTIKLHLCGSITFNGIIAAPSAVRMLSWMIPSSQKQLGDPVDDLAVATVLMVVGGQLILLRPRKSGDQEVKYDMQIFADRIEFCWIHLRGISALENSLWAYDGQGIRVWLNALAIEAPRLNENEPQDTVKESVNIPLDFYPLSVLMDKGIIIGAEHEVATRSNLPFVIFRHATSSHLFLTHILLFHLQARQVNEAVVFASHYQNLVFFAHALEMLLHTVVESDDNDSSSSHSEDRDPISSDAVLRTVVDFLDHFDVALDVVVGCARKTEMTRWKRLFNIVGNPKLLFETCLESHQLKTAASYLLVLHNLEQLDENHDDVIRLLESAVEAKDWQLCRELCRFLRSVDETGTALRNALGRVNLQDASPQVKINGD